MPGKPRKSLKSKGFRTLTHPVPTDDAAVAAYAAATEAVNRGRLRGLPAEQLTRLEADRDAAEQRVRESTIVVRMRALPRHEYAKLKAAHPPTDEDHEAMRELSGNPKDKARWHVDTFGPALLAACMVEPETVTVEEATQLRDTWNDAEWDGLLYVAIAVNEQATPTAGLVFS